MQHFWDWRLCILRSWIFTRFFHVWSPFQKIHQGHVIFCDDVVFHRLPQHQWHDNSSTESFFSGKKFTNKWKLYLCQVAWILNDLFSRQQGEGKFLPPLPWKILSLKNLFKIRLTRIYFKTIFFDSLPISLAVWIIVLIVLQIQEVKFVWNIFPVPVFHRVTSTSVQCVTMH